jgi:hypothetical protein
MALRVPQVAILVALVVLAARVVLGGVRPPSDRRVQLEMSGSIPAAQAVLAVMAVMAAPMVPRAMVVR